MADNQENYVVLARKYRPQNFDELLGQDALVQTITNAIKNNRLHHAYILTGIRGVGKTTTARIIAKALNCTGKDGLNGATINPCGICDNCRAIAESRHIDVLELDAASRTGVDDMREILDGVRYKPTAGRYKVYIIDEVHMLSKGAFNALLKTLEEPPAHVVFIFATTEIRKVPITILSRCQRFDLQRLSIDTLVAHFKNIIKKENLVAEDEALHLIAKAADGSCRDGLSLLDQAISIGAGEVRTDVVKKMIGVTDRVVVFDIFENLVNGKTEGLLAALENQHINGVNPLNLLQDLINITHLIAKIKIVPEFINDPSLSENEKEFCTRIAPLMPMSVLSKIWQMMIKGLTEINIAPSQRDALDMVLIRIAYSAGLPTPNEILDGLKKNSDIDAPEQVKNQNIELETKEATSTNNLDCPEDLLSLLMENQQLVLAYNLKHCVAFENFQNGKMVVTADEKINNDFWKSLNAFLEKNTGKKWDIDLKDAPLGQTLAEKEEMKERFLQKDALDLPLVKAIMAEFSGARIESLTRKTNNDNTGSDNSISEYNNYIEDEN